MTRSIRAIEMTATIGTLLFQRAPRVWIESQRHRILSRAEIILPDPLGEVYQAVAMGDPVTLSIGYREDNPALWQGTVDYRLSGRTRHQISIGAVGTEKPLTETIISQAFENETPEAIIKWAVEQAGMTPGRIDAPGVPFPWFVASSIPVWQVARQCAATCERAFDIDMSRWALWLDANGAVNWGDFDSDEDCVTIATGDGLIQHTPAENAAGLHKVEAFLLPGLRHSNPMILIDANRNIEETFRALRVRHEITYDKARTYVWYGKERKKY